MNFEKDAAKQLGLRSIALGFFFALTLQAGAFYASFSQRDAAFWVVHTIEVESQISRVFSLIQDMETGQRGYLLTRDTKYLEPFDDAQKNLDQELRVLTKLVSDNPGQTDNITRLAQLTGEKIIELNETIAAAKSGNFAEALSIVRTDHGNQIMQSIRTILQSTQGLEERLLDERITEYERVVKISQALSLSALIVAFLLLFIVSSRGYLLINKSIKKFIKYRDERDDELIKARERADNAREAKSQFLASMSHEIRTPMTGVVGLTEMLSKTSLDQEQRIIVENMRSANQMLNTVINDVLDYSKIEAGKLSIERISFELRCTVEEVISNFHPSAIEKGIQLTANISDAVPNFISGDPVRIRQILSNLVSNAIKFTSEDHVKIDIIEPDNDEITFKITDTGEGISNEKVLRLFQAFEQADNTVSRTHGGTGLGLAISKNLVELMDGQIDVSSKLGAGSTFWFRVPLPAADAPIHQESSTDKTNTTRVTPLKILVAEDVEINQVIIESILTDKGHTCIFVNDGEKAINAVQENDYDLILMDIRMPNVDGIEAFERIRSIKSNRCRLPIIAITADVAGDQISHFIDIGFDGVASKPINPDKLFAVMHHALEKNNPLSK